jgi:dihydropteroate synthase
MAGLLRPLGHLTGPTSEDAVAAGRAWRLAGGDACTHLELHWRDGASVQTEAYAVDTFVDRLAGLGPDERARWQSRLDGLSSKPCWPDGLPEPPLVMGIVNVTPDSFHDGGSFLDPVRAIEQGRRLAAEGAAIVDVGGESTRPGAGELSVEEELRRVVPVVRGLAREGIYVSIDTRKAPVMAAALDAGAGMVNDVTALRHDPAAIGLLTRSAVPIVLMHMQGEPGTMQMAPTYVRAFFEVAEFLEGRALMLEEAGIARERMILDPGIGFGKTVEHNLDILRHLDVYRCLGRPVALGVSRKSFIARLSVGEPTPERLPGSLAVNIWGARHGVHILRVHDVAATWQALRLWCSLGG